MFKRVFLIVLDSVGVGEAPDAAQYGDCGSNTVGNIAKASPQLRLPMLAGFGLGNIGDFANIAPAARPLASYGKMRELSLGKDTTSGHWEIAGCPVRSVFPTYAAAFPPELLERFTALTGYEVLGNEVASGTEIIARLGEEHLRTGRPIVYTSADSVFQIAAHEEIITLDKLYEICRITREQVCVGNHAVGRVIARPFIGTPGNFKRTANRHDYSLRPPCKTMLDLLKQAGFDVVGVGKISDIYAGQGLTRSVRTKSNRDGMAQVSELARDRELHGLVMANLVEFDSEYGHRNDVEGYAKALMEFDEDLTELLKLLTRDDLLIITADHGCDPTTASTDHSREYVPLLVYAKGQDSVDLGIRDTFADIAATVAANFNVAGLKYGTSFLDVYPRLK